MGFLKLVSLVVVGGLAFVLVLIFVVGVVVVGLVVVGVLQVVVVVLVVEEVVMVGVVVVVGVLVWVAVLVVFVVVALRVVAWPVPKPCNTIKTETQLSDIKLSSFLSHFEQFFFKAVFGVVATVFLMTF